MALDGPENDAFHRMALDKMTSVLGEAHARRLMSSILRSTGLTLETADDLFAFSVALGEYGGFEGAVGGLLGVQAALHGAKRPAPNA